MKDWTTGTVAIVLALGSLALWPATGAAQTPAAPQTPPPDTGAAPSTDPLDPTEVVPANNPDPLDLLRDAGDEIKLSDEKLVTRWGHAQETAPIRVSPQAGSRMIGRLRLFTEDQLPEVYPVLAARQDAQGRKWLQIRVPRRPNGRTGWIIDEMLSSSLYIVKTQLVVDRRRLRATLFKSGKRIWSSRVGIGKARTPTPRGQFWIRERLKGLGGIYGPWAFGTSAYSSLSDWPGGGVVGIHGTNQPRLIPGRPSHGCIRVPNLKIRQLARLMPIGTPVSIIN